MAALRPFFLEMPTAGMFHDRVARCGGFAGLGRASLCSVVLWDQFATDIPRARLIRINHLQSSKIHFRTVRLASNQVAGNSNLPGRKSIGPTLGRSVYCKDIKLFRVRYSIPLRRVELLGTDSAYAGHRKRSGRHDLL
jgi:hypothetical protein